MNSKFLSLKLKDGLLSAIIAVLVATSGVVLPALKIASTGGDFVVDWIALCYLSVYTFLSTLVSLFLTNSNGQPLTDEQGKILGISKK